MSGVDVPVATLGARLRSLGVRIAVAESCTGGLLAARLTAVPGSSEWFEEGLVTYSNAAKNTRLGVDLALIERHGAVSREVACAMAEGLARHSPVAATVAITGIAGPSGGSPQKPVGTVYIATYHRDWSAGLGVRHQFDGDRQAIRHASVEGALAALLALFP